MKHLKIDRLLYLYQYLRAYIFTRHDPKTHTQISHIMILELTWLSDYLLKTLKDQARRIVLLRVVLIRKRVVFTVFTVFIIFRIVLGLFRRVIYRVISGLALPNLLESILD